MNHQDWSTKYDTWMRDCVKEWNEKTNQSCTLWDDTENGINTIEISEDGSVYLHGPFGVTFAKNAVTPWKDSIHYTE